MSFITEIEDFFKSKETTIEAEIKTESAILWAKVKPLIQQIEKVGASQIIGIAETGLAAVASAVASGGSIGLAIAAAAATAEATALTDGSADAKNALYGVLSMGVAELQSAQTSATLVA